MVGHKKPAGMDGWMDICIYGWLDGCTAPLPLQSHAGCVTSTGAECWAAGPSSAQLLRAAQSLYCWSGNLPAGWSHWNLNCCKYAQFLHFWLYLGKRLFKKNKIKKQRPRTVLSYPVQVYQWTMMEGQIFQIFCLILFRFHKDSCMYLVIKFPTNYDLCLLW